MAIHRVDIHQFLALSESHPVFDVRSPGEYLHAHMPKAYSLPLFDDEQRKVVGTNYKQKSRQEAIKIGVEYFGGKMRKMIEMVERIMKMVQHYEGTVLIHCWRGGMRSAAVAWLMDIYGYEVYVLNGGYKAYRQFVLASFEKQYSFQLLGGYTGSGKTELLQELKMLFYPVIDLEEIAQHRGSAFGGIGMEAQPSQEMFENLLSRDLEKYSKANQQPIWLEDESQRIGALNIPHPIWQQMRNSSVCFIEMPMLLRLENIIKLYGDLEKEKLIEASERIRKRLGPLETTTVIALLENNNIRDAFGILLKYYDKQYGKSLQNRENPDLIVEKIQTFTNEVQDNIKTLLYHFK